MYVSLYGSDEHLARLGVAFLLLRLDVGLKYCYCLFHGACGFHHLWQEHLSASEELAHGVHAVHERSFDDADSLGVFVESLVEVGVEICGNALNQSVCQALFERFRAPFLLVAVVGGSGVVLVAVGFSLQIFRKADESFGGIGGAVEDGVLDDCELVGGNVAVEHFRGRVDNAEVHSL